MDLFFGDIKFTLKNSKNKYDCLEILKKNHVTVFINLCDKLSTHSLQTKIYNTQSFSQEAHNLVELEKKEVQ